MWLCICDPIISVKKTNLGKTTIERQCNYARLHHARFNLSRILTSPAMGLPRSFIREVAFHMFEREQIRRILIHEPARSEGFWYTNQLSFAYYFFSQSNSTLRNTSQNILTVQHVVMHSSSGREKHLVKLRKWKAIEILVTAIRYIFKYKQRYHARK